MQIADNHYQMLLICLHEPDLFCAHIRYLDGKGNITERTVVPLAQLTDSLLRVYCICRQGVRSLRLARVLSVKLRLSADVLAGNEHVRHLVEHRAAKSRR